MDNVAVTATIMSVNNANNQLIDDNNLTNFALTNSNNNNNNNNNFDNNNKHNSDNNFNYNSNNINFSTNKNSLSTPVPPHPSTTTTITTKTNTRKTESNIDDIHKLNNSNNFSKKNKNFINKVQKTTTADGVISPIDTTEEYISANLVATKLYTNQNIAANSSNPMSSNSVTAIVNLNNNHNNSNNTNQQYINPMANHSNKNAYPVLKQNSKDELIIRSANKTPLNGDKRPEIASPINNNTNNNNNNNIVMNMSSSNNGTLNNNSNNSNSNNNNHTTNGEIERSNRPKPIPVESRIVFLKVGQIDTRNERYDAEAYIECSWHDDAMFKALTTPTLNNDHRFVNVGTSNQTNITSLNALKNILKNIHNFEYDPNQHWSPQLYIENAIGDIKEEVRYKVEIVEKVHTSNSNMKVTPENVSKYMTNFTARVCEMRKLRGVFYERLELNDFPMDIQELSITLTSKKSNNDVEIVENKENPCSINTEDFLDQQEWDLFSYVKTTTKTINDPWRKYDRSGFSVTAFIARKPGYYLYNAYMLIFLITVLGFVPFAFDPASPQFRAQVTGLLLLTSVNFRWIVTQRLPSVPYLTSLDKYAIGSLLFLVCFCVWHSLIGSSIITTTNRKTIDTYVLYGLAALFLVYNLVYVIWFVKMDRTIKNFKEKCQMQQTLNVNAAKEVKDANANNMNTELTNINLTTNSNTNIANGVTANRPPLSNGIVITNNQNNFGHSRSNHNGSNKTQRQTPLHDTTLLMTSA